MKRILISAVAALFSLSAYAADIPVKAPVTAATPASCQNVSNCSGWYGLFGFQTDNLNIITNGLSNANNDYALLVGGGYQLWQGNVLAGLQANLNYEFTGQGASQPGSKFGASFLAQIGYNFFPSSVSAAPSPSQSPQSLLTPANLFAASTPYFDLGGCLRHGIIAGCAGIGVQTIIAAGWSSEFDYNNVPSQKGQPDTQVFTLKVLKHF